MLRDAETPIFGGSTPHTYVRPFSTDPSLENVVSEAASAAGVPIALITFLTKDTQWLISRIGLDVDSTPRAAAFCGWAVHNAGVTWIEDALDDPRFHDNPFVADAPYVRFYAGAPFAGPYEASVGTICVLDSKPRPYDRALEAQLLELARRVDDHLKAGAGAAP